jgi:hypothetical protein
MVPAVIVAPHMSEGAFQRTVISYAVVNDWLVSHFHDSRRQVKRGGKVVWIGDAAAAGYPDLTLVRERLVIVELKSETGRLRPTQRAWIDRLKAANVETYVWRPSDWTEVERVLAR